MLGILTGNELIQIFGNPSLTFTSLAKAIGASPDLIGKLDKADVHKFLNSQEIKTWFNGADLNNLDAGIHFVKAEGDNVLNSPSTGIFKLSQFNIDQYVLQEAERFSTGERFSRARIGTLWGEWNKTGDGEVTPPSELPMGKEGQMLMYSGGKWVATSIIEVASALHVNYDNHLDFELPHITFKTDGTLSKEESDKLDWKSLTAEVEITAFTYNGVSQYVAIALRSSTGNSFDVSLMGTMKIGLPSAFVTDGKTQSIKMNYPINVNTIFLGNMVEHGVSCPSFLDGTLKLFSTILGVTDTFIDIKMSRAVGSKSMYIKLRTRRDFAPYYEPVDPPESN